MERETIRLAINDSTARQAEFPIDQKTSPAPFDLPDPWRGFGFALIRAAETSPGQGRSDDRRPGYPTTRIGIALNGATETTGTKKNSV